MQKLHRYSDVRIDLNMNALTQYEYHLEAEYKRWEILLSSLKNENTFLMLKLSEVLDGKVDKEFILKAEYFQNEFIVKDEYIKDMENDIKRELQLLGSLHNDKLPIKSLKKHEKLKNEITYLERNFSNLRIQFNKCVE